MMNKQTKDRLEKQLASVRSRYQRNLDNMSKEKKHRRERILIEKKYDKLQVKIMRKLGTYMEDPCPIKSNVMCRSCTGYYKKNSKVKIIFKKRRHIMCKKDDTEGYRCHLKDEIQVGKELI